jgi:putative holliday junction resolvase
VLAVDPGSKRVGTALSDPTGTVAQPFRTLPAEPASTLPARIAELAREVEAGEIVVGLPLRLDGREGPEARAAREMSARLREATGLRVRLVDERLSSAAAERALVAGGARRSRRREVADQVAAAIFLQTYLETARRGG